MSKVRVILLLKAPLTGFAKRRLAAEVGDLEALVMYRWIVETLVDRLSGDLPVVAYVAPGSSVDAVRDWLGEGWEFREQCEGDLGARLEHAFSEAAIEGVDKAVVIGSDCPEVSDALLRSAFRALDDFDAVLGPSVDGGYYLLGCRTFRSEWFQDIPWSTGDVAAVTRSRFRLTQTRCFDLPVLEDVDDLASLKRVCRKLGVSPVVKRRPAV